MTTLPFWILEAKRLRQKATPGPWDWSDYGIYSTTQIDGPPGLQAPRQICSEVLLSDVEFISSAPTIQAKMERALEIALEALQLARRQLDNIKYELYGSVYTLEDDEFETTFFVRDCAEKALAEIAALGEK